MPVCGGEEEEEAEDAMQDSDEEEEDDTAERMDACGEAPETPPAGYKYALRPPLETEEQQPARSLWPQDSGGAHPRRRHRLVHGHSPELWRWQARRGRCPR